MCHPLVLPNRPLCCSENFNSSRQCVYAYRNNVIEAHCYTLQCRWIDCEQLRSSIINDWLQDVLVMKAFVSCIQNSSCNQLLIDTASQLLNQFDYMYRIPKQHHICYIKPDPNTKANPHAVNTVLLRVILHSGKFSWEKFSQIPQIDCHSRKYFSWTFCFII